MIKLSGIKTQRTHTHTTYEETHIWKPKINKTHKWKPKTFMKTTTQIKKSLKLRKMHKKKQWQQPSNNQHHDWQLNKHVTDKNLWAGCELRLNAREKEDAYENGNRICAIEETNNISLLFLLLLFIERGSKRWSVLKIPFPFLKENLIISVTQINKQQIIYSEKWIERSKVCALFSPLSLSLSENVAGEGEIREILPTA